MTVAYATSVELASFLGADAPNGADRMLERASELVDSKVRATFTVDTITLLPTDATVAAALRDATCAQVEQWLEVGEENDVDGLAGTDTSIGQLSGQHAPELAPRAARFLLTAGLLTVAPVQLTEVWP